MMPSASTHIAEPARRTKVSKEADVIVCGGGPAGIAAAIQAARKGARTQLIELHGCLGGIWTSGLLSYVLDAEKSTGLLPEIVARLQERSAHRPRSHNSFTFDPEQMKLILESMCLEAGVEIRLHTRLVGAHLVEEQRLDAVVTESKSGREAWRAKVFIDCTGDGDLGALAGCSYSIGRDDTGETQPMSLLATVSGIDVEQARPFFSGQSARRKEALCHEIEQGGFTPSYRSPGLFHLRDDLFALMATHHYGVRPDDAEAITRATLDGRREVDSIIHALQARGGPWSNIQLVATATQIGVRDGRRLHGLVSVQANDLATGRSWPDAVCRATFPMDVHSPNPAISKDYDHRGRSPVKPYDIPLRALIARDVHGLLMAGRCISGDFLAHSSYRVTGNAVPMGEAAGSAAAHCVLRGCLPHELAEITAPPALMSLHP